MTLRKTTATCALAAALLAALVPLPVVASYSCALSTVSVNYGTYNPLYGSPTLTTGKLTVTCTLSGTETVNVSLTAKLDKGIHGSSYTDRRMELIAGSTLLGYKLNKTLDASCVGTQVWGDAGADMQTGGLQISNAAPEASVEWDIYGCIPGAQNVGVGSYADTVGVTVEYLP